MIKKKRPGLGWGQGSRFTGHGASPVFVGVLGLIHLIIGCALTPDQPTTDAYTAIPNIELQTHDGQTVRFYDDLIRDKVVLINFMYTNCDGL